MVLIMNLKKWESATEWPLTALSLLFLVIYAWQILSEPTGIWNRAAEFSMNALWVVFGVDYVVSLLLAEKKWEWFKHHVFDLLVVLLPMVRPLRVLRVLTALNALHRTSGMALRGRITMYVGASVTLIVFIGSLAVLDAERSAPGASIKTFGQALWWTFVTITTVGYGDYAPVTSTGRVIAFVLMLGGIALIGVVTATLASWIVDAVSAEEHKESSINHEEVAEISHRLERIERKLDDSEGRGVAMVTGNPGEPKTAGPHAIEMDPHMIPIRDSK
ncbi:potassium channel family protein [Bifidobacterium crudilactis]|uniref:potassium channel family protein n=1 Tax=Bifidobacterium crudilactis TaxID=327277 RepID=UPI0026470D7B|nr:potassium channel family protein [Bifidobacterium crudilactis]